MRFGCIPVGIVPTAPHFSNRAKAATAGAVPTPRRAWSTPWAGHGLVYNELGAGVVSTPMTGALGTGTASRQNPEP